eukprot:CAMPEP_0175914608 /NCGR_PEP_ID=MMETSP0108-20121206/9881_1 /TAXON_ID=195067 ORGANISM="Goniomonas pacifica, Strain CCMP1869" /NCGR_SAMPLE_ID=MMETSP0108 /ASSEMBLY_ACC=CAM_ASM_000204 /LENGTH=53 /DNA_ID=CAMNT_0017237059 /DNA_START=270 /DNA_END=431 /DNA_ORIENTATION=+
MALAWMEAEGGASASDVRLGGRAAQPTTLSSNNNTVTGDSAERRAWTLLGPRE